LQLVTGLYRHSAQLAAYYRARVDALYMTDTDYTFTKLVDKLMPEIDFRKTLSSPFEETLKLLGSITLR
jgi:hypothetical protein